MRKILFRSWNIIDKCFYYFENGTYYYFGERGSKIIVEEFVFNWKNAQQFTGLLDKKGNKIFEGDELRDDWINDLGEIVEDYCVVAWYNSNGCWAIDNSYKKNGSSYTNLVNFLGLNNLEIIGNIHEDESV